MNVGMDITFEESPGLEIPSKYQGLTVNWHVRIKLYGSLENYFDGYFMLSVV